MTQLWEGQAGSFYLLFGGEPGKAAMLLNMDGDQYVLTHCLEYGSWRGGKYFYDFDRAYKTWKEEYEEQ